MLETIKRRLDSIRQFLGVRLLVFQGILLGIALAVAAIFRLLQGGSNIGSTLIYTFVAGNLVVLLMSLLGPDVERNTTRRFPWNWLLYLAQLVPVSLVASAVAALVLSLEQGVPGRLRVQWIRGQIPFGALVSFTTGVLLYAFATTRLRMAAANSRLAEEVQRERAQTQSHASELQAAFEIQSRLLPTRIPQIAGVEIACAWQPAKTVSGDFFDVLELSETSIGVCLADVSGKGMSAALLTANLQATFRAFAANEPSPARLCERLNQTLCATLPTGRFITFVYGVIDRRQMTLRYEIAGHGPPLLLRGQQAIALEGGGPVLGVIADAVYADRTIALRAGDRVVLSTDGVTEAFDRDEEEFGEERLIAAASRRDLSSAHAIRVAVMDEVTRFADGNFQDDASLMIVMITA